MFKMRKGKLCLLELLRNVSLINEELLSIAYFLMKNQADVRIRDKKQKSLIHYMAQYGYIASLMELINELENKGIRLVEENS